MKKRTSLPSNEQGKGKGKEKEKEKEKDQAGMGGLEDSAPIVSHPVCFFSHWLRAMGTS